jgi:hypothetical protein
MYKKADRMTAYRAASVYIVPYSIIYTHAKGSRGAVSSENRWVLVEYTNKKIKKKHLWDKLANELTMAGTVSGT